MVTLIKSLISQQAQGIRGDALAHKNVQTEILQLNECQILPQEEKVFTFFLLDKGHFQIPPHTDHECVIPCYVLSANLSTLSLIFLSGLFLLCLLSLRHKSSNPLILFSCYIFVHFCFPLFNHLCVLTLSAFLSMLIHTNFFYFQKLSLILH